MKRPFALAGFSYLLALAAAVLCGARLSLILACCCLAGFLFFLLFPKAHGVGVCSVAFVSAALAFGSFSSYSASQVEPVNAFADRDAVVEGTVCELPYSAYGRFYYVLKVDSLSLPGAPETMKIRLSSGHALRVEPYSRVRAKIRLFLPDGGREEGRGYSSRAYYASKGITMFAFLYEYEPVSVSPPAWKPPYYYALRVRQALLRSVRTLLPPQEAALVSGVVFGERTGLSQQVEDDFRTVGITHILSVSGLHMATMAQLLMALLLLLRVPKRLSALVSAAGVLGFMAITCFVPPVVRSGVMCLLYLFGLLLSRRADALTSLGVSVLLIGLLNPYAAADVGLLLSFFATLGLILFSGPICAYCVRKCGKIKLGGPLVRGGCEIVATTAAASLFTLPIGIVAFGTVSLAAPLANLLELVPSTLMMNSAAVASALHLAAPQTALTMPFALAAGLLAKYMQACARLLARIPFAGVPASYGFVLIWLAGTMILFAAALRFAKSKLLYRAAGWLSLILLLTGIFSYQLSVRGAARLAVLDVGTGEAVVLTCGGRAAVIGCGGFSSAPVASYLRGQGVAQLDYLQPLTQEPQELKNCAELAGTFSPKHLAVQREGAEDSFLQAALPRAGKLSSYAGSAAAKIGETAALQTVSDGNASAVRVTLHQISVVIRPRELPDSALPKEWLSSDFLITDTEKAAEWSPFYTILSVEEEDLQAVFRKTPAGSYFATGGNGNIVLQTKGDGTMQIRRES